MLVAVRVGRVVGPIVGSGDAVAVAGSVLVAIGVAVARGRLTPLDERSDDEDDFEALELRGVAVRVACGVAVRVDPAAEPGDGVPAGVAVMATVVGVRLAASVGV